MATDETIFPQEKLDRTPYRSCIWLSLAYSFLFLILVVGLLGLSQFIKTGKGWGWNLHFKNPFSQNIPQTIQKQANQAINQTTNNLKQNAQKAATDAVNSATQQTTKDATGQVKQQLQNITTQHVLPSQNP
jgi:predicted PurR-regulated permease PerM